MPPRNNNANFRSAAFTLVELILVMVVMVTILAFVAPMLGRSFKQRGLDQEATRLLSLTEYGRQEAISNGVPTQVWVDPQSGNYGVEIMPGYPDQQIHTKQFTLPANVHFEVTSGSQAPTAEGYVQVIQFDPDGAPAASSGIGSIRIVDQFDGSASLTLTADGWGYEITKEAANASRTR